jgi:hypothetical protein
VGSQINVPAALFQKNKLDTSRNKRVGGPPTGSLAVLEKRKKSLVVAANRNMILLTLSLQSVSSPTEVS